MAAPTPGGGPAPRRLDPEARRAQILDAAAAVFRTRDPSSVRFDEIATAAGVSRSLVYAYFGDRAGLMASVYLRTLAGLDEQLAALLRDVPIDEARLGRLVRGYMHLVERNADMWRLFAAAGTLEHAEVATARAGRIRAIAETWGGGPEARLVARGIIGMLEAAATEWLDDRACPLDRAAEVVAFTLWHGIARLPLTKDNSLSIPRPASLEEPA